MLKILKSQYYDGNQCPAYDYCVNTGVEYYKCKKLRARAHARTSDSSRLRVKHFLRRVPEEVRQGTSGQLCN